MGVHGQACHCRRTRLPTTSLLPPSATTWVAALPRHSGLIHGSMAIVLLLWFQSYLWWWRRGRASARSRRPLKMILGPGHFRASTIPVISQYL
jgi:hypothetical protein